MGLYSINCPACKAPHVWFSGSMDQRCEACKNPKEWYIREYPTEGGTCAEIVDFIPKNSDETEAYYVAIQKSAFDFQCKQGTEIAEEFNKLAKSHAALQDIWEKQYLELEHVKSQLLTEKAEVGRLLALNKRRSKS